MDQHTYSGNLSFLLLTTLLVSVEGQWYKPWCQYIECCNDRWIRRDYYGVKMNLVHNLFGQHLVQQVVYASLKGHVVSQPVKPLVLSFHGSTGTGKNFVSQWIGRDWFTKGMDSGFVHFFSATKDFPLKYRVDLYETYLKGYVYQHTRSCGHQIFIFDEVDSFPPGLLNSIRTFLEYHEKVDGVDFRNTIFIFLSNIGESSLKNKTEDFYRNNQTREDLKLAETEPGIVSEVLNTKGTEPSLRHLVATNLISHFVPFLPLERRHVRECIRRELRRFQRQHDLKLVDDVMDELQFHGENNNFSVKGCKNVAEKVNYVLSTREFKRRSDL